MENNACKMFCELTGDELTAFMKSLESISGQIKNACTLIVRDVNDDSYWMENFQKTT